MNAHNLIAIALAALLVFAGGAAALPGNAPDGVGADENETATNETDSEDPRDGNASEGPPTDMPEPVPDHVTTIHQLIRDKLDGDLGNTTLGEAISGVVGGDDEADGQADSTDEPSSQANERAGPPSSLPEQAADHVGAIHDAITSFLNGDGGNPGDAVGTAASG